MKKPVIIFLFSLIVYSTPLFSQVAEVVYVDGNADIKKPGGVRYMADFGDPLNNGDTVITGSDGRLDMEKDDQQIIKVSPDTVFTVQERRIGTEKKNVYKTALGSVFFRFMKLTGNEPDIATGTTVAGVRGTELTVYAAVDGSSLFLVDSGKVEVSSAGETVELLPGEGVEVESGRAPGEKFEVKRGKIDYSSWNKERLLQFIEDPVQSVQRIQAQMDNFIAEINTLEPLRKDLIAFIEEERPKLEKLEEEKGKEARKEYYLEKVYPLEVEVYNMNLNIRYYALSALSLKRYVLGRLYMIMKARYIDKLDDPVFVEFYSIYQDIGEQFESNVVQYLVEGDI